jgi:ankyrin repeat protein
MKLINLILIYSLIFWGCSTFRERSEETASLAYFKSRALDLADIFSFTFVLNTYGARAAVSTSGVGMQMDGILIAPTLEAGLRMGVIGTSGCYSYTIGVTIFEKCESSYGNMETRQIVEDRHKSISISFAETEGNNAIIGRFGISAGLFIGFRFEVNLLEAGDFLLGLIGFDPLGDDIYKKDSRTNALQTFLNSKYEDTPKAKLVIDQGLDVNTLNLGHDQKGKGNSLLIEALDSYNAELTSYLLEKGADPNISNTWGENALVYSRSPELMELVLNKSKIPITKESLGKAISFYAKFEYIRDEEQLATLIKLLIDKGGDVNYNGGEPVLNAFVSKKFKLLESLVLKHKAKTNYVYKSSQDAIYGYPLIYRAVNNQRFDEVEILIRLGFDVNQTDATYKQTPLFLLSSNCANVDQVRYLLKNGANKNLKNFQGKSPFEQINTYMVQDKDSKQCNEMRQLLK